MFTGNVWLPGRVTFTTTKRFQLVFAAARLNGPNFDIAIDDVIVNGGSCSVEGSCTFDHGLCTWRQVFEDDLDWTLYTVSSQPIYVIVLITKYDAACLL